MSSRDEDLNDPQVASQALLDGLQARMWTALPGVVVSADLAAQTCTVQPTVQGVTTDRNGTPSAVNLPLLPDVPIVWPRAGGFAVTLPLQAGDEVLVVFASRCIDAWWQSGGVGAPLEARMHDLSDAFAIPGPTSQPRVLTDVQADGVELRDEARTTYLRVTAGTIHIKGNIVHESGTITSNGVNVGSTHTHAGSPTAPNGPVSPTGAPL